MFEDNIFSKLVKANFLEEHPFGDDYHAPISTRYSYGLYVFFEAVRVAAGNENRIVQVSNKFKIKYNTPIIRINGKNYFENIYVGSLCYLQEKFVTLPPCELVTNDIFGNVYPLKPFFGGYQVLFDVLRPEYVEHLDKILQIAQVFDTMPEIGASMLYTQVLASIWGIDLEGEL